MASLMILTADELIALDVEGRGRARRIARESSIATRILQMFLDRGGPIPVGEILAGFQGDSGESVRDALLKLDDEDLIRISDGHVDLAYPFSASPTPFLVRFHDGRERHVCCAIDALGIAPMFGQPIDVESPDPVSGEAIRARVSPDGAAEWSPDSAVVVAGAIRGLGDACFGCCPVLNFFASPANAERWLSEHLDVRGNVISMREAAAAGRAVFGDVLREP
jgi:hypothetical protein